MGQIWEDQMDSIVYEIKIGQCENQEEYEALVRENEALYVGWREHVLPMLRKNDLTAKQIAEGCGISLSSASSFSRKIPSKRENVIMMAMMMRLSVEETNELLTRWAHFQKLYAKHPCDVIWIYLLQKGGSDRPAALFREYYAVYEQIRQKYDESSFPERNSFDTWVVFDVITGKSKQKNGAQKIAAQADESFCEMMEYLMPSFKSGYQKLLNYLNSFFVDIEEEDDRKLGLSDTVDKYEKKKLTPKVLFSDKREVLDRYYRKMRDLKNDHIIPSRTFLVALGIHLSMNTQQLNTMLDYAGMGPLCPKDRLEGSIVFYLEELYCQIPTIFHPDSLEIDPTGFELLDYSSQGSRSEFTMTPPILLDLDDLPAENLNDYIKRRIEETNIFENDDEKAVKAFLEML